MNIDNLFTRNVVGNTIEGMTTGIIAGAANGVITENIYQKQLNKGHGPFLNSDVAEALGERAGDIAANLEASGLESLWPYGHNYANQIVDLPGSICIGIQTGRCTINISPYAPMIPTNPTYYVPKP